MIRKLTEELREILEAEAPATPAPLVWDNLLAAQYKTQYKTNRARGPEQSPLVFLAHLRVESPLNLPRLKRQEGDALCGKVKPDSFADYLDAMPPPEKQCPRCAELARTHRLPIRPTPAGRD